MSLPALRHHVEENIWAVLWSLHLATLLHVRHDLLIGKTLVGNLGQCGHLPQHHAVAPDVRLACELSVTNRLRSHPTDRQEAASLLSVVLRLIHVPSHPKVTNFDHCVCREHAVSRGQIPETLDQLWFCQKLSLSLPVNNLLVAEIGHPIRNVRSHLENLAQGRHLQVTISVVLVIRPE